MRYYFHPQADQEFDEAVSLEPIPIWCYLPDQGGYASDHRRRQPATAAWLLERQSLNRSRVYQNCQSGLMKERESNLRL